MKFWNTSNSKNREAAVAGSFYPGTKESLGKELKRLFEKAGGQTSEDLVTRAIISPHAGYIFSGKVAASAYTQLPDHAIYKRVFILASSHRFHFHGACIYTAGNYETPLGEIEVDIELGKKLSNSASVFTDDSNSHEHEHSLEVQLPFLQYRLGNSFQIVPIVIGTNSPEDCRQLAEALLPYFTRDNLFVISSDFSHYPDYQQAIETDQLTADAICSNDPNKLLSVIETIKGKNIPNLATSLCGWTSVLTLLYITSSKEVKYKQLDYQNSGDIEPYGDKSKVVGYWAIGVREVRPLHISKKERQQILQVAKNSICKFFGLQHSKIKLPGDASHILNQKSGVFISVYVKNELRGCIGGFEGNKTLKSLIKEMSVSAISDRRFKHLQADEIEHMKLEVSVLTPLKKISDPDEIEPGRHGIYIKSGLNSGTFLPQVAAKTGWSKEELLEKCSKDKAGLGHDGWKGAELYTYEALVIKED